MPQIRDMRELNPYIIPAAAEWLRRCAAKKYPVLVIETRREWDVMEAYFARGRKPVAEVKALYAAAGLGAISTVAAKKKITNAPPGKSWHYFGCAIDAVPMVKGKPDWKYNPEDPADLYDEISQIARDLGFVWGGTWRTFKDRPHIQMHTGWGNINEALAWSKAHKMSWKLPLKAA